ncbi:FadR family transcriptional regulator [Actinosynnema pretiosum subsp. pretiosum]|uniref:GntR domain protein n=2 Tax=Actinosynnema TaxID=40566 RepID=C6WGV8_ACTMD|nr:FCD domain-containing protein [Actinosynnema mirum]ACU36026.1 GntR domain protein [Actinosynnema mirum DSM 43827]AXX29479.1 Transcriptional regulator, GntR family [Actinosynnema pretiosum subsp. pretiosum]QUF06281.1 FadR family transcriptional regulator [Actinosynnema pretiosum subsp. pretiosum]
MIELTDALFRPVRAGNAFEETVERLVQAVRLGVVSPGDRLPAERDLAARLGVSRATLREALKSLQDNGYVESRRGRYGGTFITGDLPNPTSGAAGVPWELTDALLLRAALEAGAAELAAGTALSPERRRDLRARQADCAEAGLPDYRRKDSRLHLAIAEAAGSPSLTAAIADVRMRVNALLDRIPLLPPNLAHSNDQHTRVVDAVLDGDPEAARRAMAEHLEGTAALLRGFLS